MNARQVRGAAVFAAAALVALVVVSGVPELSQAWTPEAGTRAGELVLNVGGQDEMKTRNLLPASANDVWTSDVIFRAYGGPILGDPDSDQALAYIGKGFDVDQDAMFEPASEYNEWAEQAGVGENTPLVVRIYYDFNGVTWHDGVQMTPWDLFFSYHLSSMNARFNTDLRVLFPNGVDSSYDPGRQLNIEYDTKNWEGEGTLVGDPNLRVAVKFSLTEPFALFSESTIFPVLLPMHLWSGTGGGRHSDENNDGLPDDYGCAVWVPVQEANDKGIPQCGTGDPAQYGKGIPLSNPKAFDYFAAENWDMKDQDLIGSGPFEFDTWLPGIEARVVRFESYFTGVDDQGTEDEADDVVYDGRLASVLSKPTIEGIRFKVYRTTQLGVFALQSGEIDFYHWNVGAEFVPDLLKIPSIAVESNAEPGFFYLAFNMREAPWGYQGNDPDNDVGYRFRQAVKYLIPKKNIVQSLLQNFGVIGHGVISPANTFWYYDGISKPDFNLDSARAELNSPEAQAAGISADPAGACSKDTPSGCRVLGPQGRTVFQILTPQADYDPVRASAGAMIAQAMRDVGINAVAQPMAFGEIVNRINTHDFDMYILGWRIGGTDPDYLFSFFHSSNAASGQNYVGFNNATFDQVMEDSRAELDRLKRRTLIQEAQVILSDARPYDVLYYRTNIEGYRQDRFLGWMVNSGTIWGFWSLMRIAPPSSTSLRAEQPVMRSAVSANQTTPVTVTVRDHQQFALEGATVNLTTSLGELRLGPQTGKTFVVGTTNVNGQMPATFVAPPVESQTPVLISASARHPDFEQPHRSTPALVTVFPPGQSFLSLEVRLPAGDVVRPGSQLIMTVEVTDENTDRQDDSVVAIGVDPPGILTPLPASGSALEVATVTLNASDAVTVAQEFQVTVHAEKTGYASGTGTVVVTILPEQSSGECPPGQQKLPDGRCGPVTTPGLEVVAIVAVIGVAALIMGARYRRRREG